MTLKEQRHWLTTRQQWAKATLLDAERMVIGQVLIENAREDLAATTALLETLKSFQLELFAERTFP